MVGPDGRRRPCPYKLSSNAVSGCSEKERTLGDTTSTAGCVLVVVDMSQLQKLKTAFIWVACEMDERRRLLGGGCERTIGPLFDRCVEPQL